MAPKATFIFFAVCFIFYMIDSGVSLRCYSCNMAVPCCTQCAAPVCDPGVKYCASGYQGAYRQCLKDSELPECNKNMDCKPCQVDLCNTAPLNP